VEDANSLKNIAESKPSGTAAKIAMLDVNRGALITPKIPNCYLLIDGS